jgi:nucleoside 2-deoxyribosyltransferase
MLVYVAGPYIAPTHDGISKNIKNAREVAIVLWECGFTAITPHLNTAHFEVDAELKNEQYVQGDLEIVARCDAVVVLPNYEKSVGTGIEIAFANEHGIPVYYWPTMPVKPATEAKRPEQCKAFLSEVMRMYRVHLSKNEDYSPANILGTGEIGLATRMWDKVARYLNLIGFRIEITSPATFEQPSKPKHESIDDTLRDLAVYGVIGQLLRRGVWGR